MLTQYAKIASWMGIFISALQGVRAMQNFGDKELMGRIMSLPWMHDGSVCVPLVLYTL